LRDEQANRTLPGREHRDSVRNEDTVKKTRIFCLAMSWIIIFYPLFAGQKGQVAKQIQSDSLEISSFSRRINERFENYADTSRDRNPKTDQKIVAIGLIHENGFVDVDSAMLYTFDKKDSCKIYLNSLKGYTIYVDSLSIPEGDYWLKISGHDLTRVHRFAVGTKK
jgi:AAA15 family ATPase/GTPase